MPFVSNHGLKIESWESFRANTATFTPINSHPPQTGILSKKSSLSQTKSTKVASQPPLSNATKASSQAAAPVANQGPKPKIEPPTVKDATIQTPQIPVHGQQKVLPSPDKRVADSSSSSSIHQLPTKTHSSDAKSSTIPAVPGGKGPPSPTNASTSGNSGLQNMALSALAAKVTTLDSSSISTQSAPQLNNISNKPWPPVPSTLPTVPNSAHKKSALAAKGTTPDPGSSSTQPRAQPNTTSTQAPPAMYKQSEAMHPSSPRKAGSLKRLSIPNTKDTAPQASVLGNTKQFPSSPVSSAVANLPNVHIPSSSPIPTLTPALTPSKHVHIPVSTPIPSLPPAPGSTPKNEHIPVSTPTPTLTPAPPSDSDDDSAAMYLQKAQIARENISVIRTNYGPAMSQLSTMEQALNSIPQQRATTQKSLEVELAEEKQYAESKINSIDAQITALQAARNTAAADLVSRKAVLDDRWDKACETWEAERRRLQTEMGPIQETTRAAEAEIRKLEVKARKFEKFAELAAAFADEEAGAV